MVRRRTVVVGLGVLALAGAGAAYALTAPRPLGPDVAVDAVGDAARGERIFHLGGCQSCHGAPDKSGKFARADGPLAGGLRLETEFGTFVVPNISPHETAGIGAWSRRDFASAMLRGVSPEGAHYYPSFPYASYARMPAGDVADLHAYLATLEPSEAVQPDHELGFPFNIRRSVGGWKLLYLRDDWVTGDVPDERVERGRAIVEGPGHCAECHTPRDALGGLDRSRWMAGGPNPDGEGSIPNITPHEDGIGGWSEADIAYYLETGFTPEFDSVGGSMVAVQRELSKVSAEDREAIAAYLKFIEPKPIEASETAEAGE